MGNPYVFWAVTGAIALGVGIIGFLLKMVWAQAFGELGRWKAVIQK